MPEIVVINGPSGVGKTTVAKALSALQPGTVYTCSLFGRRSKWLRRVGV